MDNGDSHDDQDIKLESKGAMDIHEDTFVIAYLKACGVLVGLTPKKQIHVVHKAKWPLIMVSTNG
jgi:hypothetical protein